MSENDGDEAAKRTPRYSPRGMELRIVMISDPTPLVDAELFCLVNKFGDALQDFSERSISHRTCETDDADHRCCLSVLSSIQ